ESQALAHGPCEQRRQACARAVGDNLPPWSKLAQQPRNGLAIDCGNRQVMKRSRMAVEMPFDLFVAARPQLVPLVLKVLHNETAEGFAGLKADFAALECRVAMQVDLGVQGFGFLARHGG